MVTATATTLNAFQMEAGCGWGGPGGMFFSESFQDNVTANPGGGQANAFQLTRQNNRITTVASPADSIKLPPALPGLELVVVNHGTNSMQVFGQGTDVVDDVVAATGVPQMPNSTTLYYCMTQGFWYTEGLASGYVPGGVGSFQTMSVQTGIVAHAGGGQGSATPLTAMNCFVATVATAGDSLLLPPAKPGMENHRHQSVGDGNGPERLSGDRRDDQRPRGQHCDRGGSADRPDLLLRNPGRLVE
jgi:hypothetical protein